MTDKSKEWSRNFDVPIARVGESAVVCVNVTEISSNALPDAKVIEVSTAVTVHASGNCSPEVAELLAEVLRAAAATARRLTVPRKQ